MTQLLILKNINQYHFKCSIHQQELNQKRMIKNKKVQKLLDEGGLEATKFTIVLRLRDKIAQLCQIIDCQNSQIESYKKSAKNTIFNEMEVQIQHLNDQNRRLVYLLEQKKKGEIMKNLPLQKKMQSTNSKPLQKKTEHRDKFQQKYYAVLAQNDKLKKELINFKVHDNYSKSKKSINDQSTVAIIRSLTQVEKIKQKNCDLEAQVANYQKKIEYLQKKNQQREIIPSKNALEY